MDLGLKSIQEVFQHQCGICFEEYNDSNRYPMIVCQLQHYYCRGCCLQIIFKTTQVSQCPQCRKVARRDCMIEFRSLNKIRIALQLFTENYQIEKSNFKKETEKYKQQLKKYTQKQQKKNKQIMDLQKQLSSTTQRMNFQKNKAQQCEEKIAEINQKMKRLRQKLTEAPSEKVLQTKIIELSKLKSWEEILGKKEVALIGKGLEKLPESISELVNLQVLQLQMNKIYALPQSIVDLKTVKKLIINNNKLKSLPANINQLIELKQINIAFNQIDQLPENFCKLKKLQTLRAYENSINKLPENFGSLESLRHLYIYKNFILSFPSSFNKLSELSILYFDMIPKSEVISTFPVNNLKKLKYITIYFFPHQKNQQQISQLKVQCERNRIKLQFQEYKQKC